MKLPHQKPPAMDGLHPVFDPTIGKTKPPAFKERIRACLGVVPSVVARQHFAASDWTLKPSQITLRYDFIQVWEPLIGLKFDDGEEFITFYDEKDV